MAKGALKAAFTKTKMMMSSARSGKRDQKGRRRMLMNADRRRRRVADARSDGVDALRS
jgi:hypothetical protein